jgi:NH3-dependent NAD+ synthetase|tara:strand:- start:141 stop:449 length:309 start_codon:yes stop_codon:yes gene_type:complete
MAKWSKPKDTKLLAERKIYSQIKSAEKTPRSKVLNKDQEDLKYYFAMYCHKHRYEKAPSGTLWPAVFERKWGMSLSEYGELLRQRQKEKHEVRSTQVDDALP